MRLPIFFSLLTLVTINTTHAGCPLLTGSDITELAAMGTLAAHPDWKVKDYNFPQEYGDMMGVVGRDETFEGTAQNKDCYYNIEVGDLTLTPQTEQDN